MGEKTEASEAPKEEAPKATAAPKASKPKKNDPERGELITQHGVQLYIK